MIETFSLHGITSCIWGLTKMTLAIMCYAVVITMTLSILANLFGTIAKTAAKIWKNVCRERDRIEEQD